MSKDDFKLIKIDTNEGHEDYWYSTNKVANEYLMDKYMEQGMKAIFRVVYSKDEDIIGIERTFQFSYDVISPEDKELHNILKELSK